jgi:transcriptional regulator with PAS, ATPase and Fis domain
MTTGQNISDPIAVSVDAGQPSDPAAKVRRELALWQSAAMREVIGIIRDAASVDITVLITGETGTGKDVVARAVHALSTRCAASFVSVNCAAVPHDLLESELFGHERGAFTGAHQLKIGKFEAAHRGTIFLDEIGDLHPDLQGKLLHVLQNGQFSRVGGKSSVKADVRVIAATNQNLERAVTEGRFRQDLYYRLNVVHIAVPPLRQRPEEIPILLNYFVELYSGLFHREPFAVPQGIVDALSKYHFPGNVRELENVAKRMIVLGSPSLAALQVDLSVAVKNGSVRMPGAPTSLKEIGRRAALAAQREAIAGVLKEHGWSRVRAAKALRISYRALLYKMKETGLQNGNHHGGHVS